MYIFALVVYLFASLYGFESVDNPSSDSKDIKFLYDIGNVLYLLSALNDFLKIKL